MPDPHRPLIPLTGATGYLGGRLLHALEARGERVRCISRRSEYLSARVGPGTEVIYDDVSGPETLRAALEDVETADCAAASTRRDTAGCGSRSS